MKIACILAAGSGTRCRSSAPTPKQFVLIKKKPVVVYTAEQFISHPQIDQVVVVCHQDWIDYLKTFSSMQHPKVTIISGGGNRNLSLQCALTYLHTECHVCDDDIILTHDGVRMFVNHDIIDRNLQAMEHWDAVGTYMPTTDTIAITRDAQVIEIPSRETLMNAQTPQTFRYHVLHAIYRTHVVDTSDVCAYVKVQTATSIGIVMGSYRNFKITHDEDLWLAEEIIKFHQ